MIPLTSSQKQLSMPLVKGMKVRRCINQAKREFQEILNELQFPDHSNSILITYEKSNRFHFTISTKKPLSTNQLNEQDMKLQKIQQLRKRRRQIKQRIKQIDKLIKDKRQQFQS